MPRPRVLFARNLFLPEDLGGNRYPYETMRRLAARGYPVTVATPRLHSEFPKLANLTYHLYPIWRPHPSVSHFTNLLGATLAFRNLPRHDVAISGSYDAALAPSGVRATQYSILALLSEAGSLSISDLASRLDLDRTTTGKNLRPLTTARLVRIAIVSVPVNGRRPVARW